MSKRMVIRGCSEMLGAEPRNPDLPPDPELPPADGRMPVKFIGKRVSVNAYSAETLLKFAHHYAHLTLQAERERVAAVKGHE